MELNWSLTVPSVNDVKKWNGLIIRKRRRGTKNEIYTDLIFTKLFIYPSFKLLLLNAASLS
ncbi:hypothetical protein MKY37_13515 [Psychrobacillus sp. FSL K6-2836]|uniref:hypothetical protein n=1 Tax=Psychrobacillus sp. FSL K6-2836 TaxID=2921548 RepID=UPI0030F73C22